MSDGKEVKRYYFRPTGGETDTGHLEFTCNDESLEGDDWFVPAADHDRVVTELKNEMAAIRAQGYNDWRMDLKRANETIAELRAEVVKARSSFTNSEAEIFNLKKQIATQARVIEIAKRVLHNAGLRPPDGGTPTVETICEDLSDAMTEIAAIEKEGEK